MHLLERLLNNCQTVDETQNTGGLDGWNLAGRANGNARPMSVDAKENAPTSADSIE